MRFTQATTSWLEGLDGLSRLITPELMYDLISRFRGEEPFGMGVKWPVRTMTGNEKGQQGTFPSDRERSEERTLVIVPEEKGPIAGV
jgi:hypothetical protein